MVIHESGTRHHSERLSSVNSKQPSSISLGCKASKNAQLVLESFEEYSTAMIVGEAELRLNSKGLYMVAV